MDNKSDIRFVDANSMQLLLPPKWYFLPVSMLTSLDVCQSCLFPCQHTWQHLACVLPTSADMPFSVLPSQCYCTQYLTDLYTSQL